MQTATTCDFIDEGEIQSVLAKAQDGDKSHVRQVLAKARQLEGLSETDVASLLAIDDADLREQLYAAAQYVKQEIYGSRLVLFAPLYISNLCRNECVYCAFRVGNRQVKRRALNQEQIAAETRILLAQGHKRLLLVAGESYPPEGFDYVLHAIDSIYAARHNGANIRRVNVNVAPLNVEQFAQLKARKIGTYQIFQETYHRPTYAKVHVSGQKRDYDWRIMAPHRAMEAGIDDVGIGVLLGLHDWRFETLAMMRHIAALERDRGVGPHTVSVPRMEPAVGSELAARPAHPASDEQFKMLVAILRLAVPYTGIIMSTRENAAMRRATFALGVSQISAGSRTNPGGYSELGSECDESQFQLGDHRSLDEVVADVASLGYVPSFCTGCYRMGRTGRDFMDLAKPGLIKHHCGPNALSSFQEYLNDYATPPTRQLGQALIDRIMASSEPSEGKISSRLVGRVRCGERDVFV